MPDAEDGDERRPSEARERLLKAASLLFYREGIHSVGVDRVIEEAGVTRATFYRHFPGKDDLVTAYLEREDRALRAAAEKAAKKATDPRDLLPMVLDGVADEVGRKRYRGCPFINAAAEYPDAKHPVRVAIREHRAWFKGVLVQAVTLAGRPDAEALAESLVLLRDAALVGGYLDGSHTAKPAFLRTARKVCGLEAAEQEAETTAD